LSKEAGSTGSRGAHLVVGGGGAERGESGGAAGSWSGMARRSQILAGMAQRGGGARARGLSVVQVQGAAIGHYWRAQSFYITGLEEAQSIIVVPRSSESNGHRSLCIKQNTRHCVKSNPKSLKQNPRGDNVGLTAAGHRLGGGGGGTRAWRRRELRQGQPLVPYSESPD
jgi:hypothetical protein